MNKYASPKSIRHEALQYADMFYYAGRIVVGKVVEWTQSSIGRKVVKTGLGVLLGGGSVLGLGEALNTSEPGYTQIQIDKAPVVAETAQPGQGVRALVLEANHNINLNNHEIFDIEQAVDAQYGINNQNQIQRGATYDIPVPGEANTNHATRIHKSNTSPQIKNSN